jgi:hypothetical protein
LCGDTIVLRVKRKLRSGSKLERTIANYIRVHRESNGASFGEGFRFVVSFGITFVLFGVIFSLGDLPYSASKVLVVVLSLTVGGVVTFKPTLALRVVCIVLAFVGFTFTVISLYVENVSELGFNASLLGAGTSIMAIAIAVYALIQTQQGKDVVSIDKSGRGVRNSEEGYVWIEEIKKFRCEYCKDLGRYRYYKTLSGIKKHIAREHVKRRI